ncbi:MAG TPA: hypothetical protein VFM55_11075 [Micromonosporaceae bacterium]|nr:hypothetical protein [Micromonosporaceae bacterium]
MRHPTDGTLRRFLDEPAGVADADRQHVADCPVCLAGLAAAQEDAAVTAAALDVEPTVDVDAGWRRLSRAVTADEPRRAVAPARGPRWRTALRSPVVAAVAAVALLTGATAAAATDWLQIFRTERVAPVLVSRADLVALPDLSAYGQLEVTDEVEVRDVADADAAARATGLSVPQVGKLPRGVVGEPAYRVGDQVSVVFTFSVEKAARVAAATGEPLPPPPPGLDGSQFRLNAGPGFAAVWSDLNSHLIGEVERVCDRVVILDKGRVTAAGTLPELLGRRELRLRLDGVTAQAQARLAAAGPLAQSGDAFTVTLPAEDDHTTVPDLVADLVGLGVRVHAVKPARISLEERLLDILRTGPGEERR